MSARHPVHRLFLPPAQSGGQAVTTTRRLCDAQCRTGGYRSVGVCRRNGRLPELRVSAGRLATYGLAVLVPVLSAGCGSLLGGEEAGALAAQRQPSDGILGDGTRPPRSVPLDAELPVEPGGWRRLRSRVEAPPDYRLVSLGESGAGDEWRIELAPDAAQRPEGFILALFDERGCFLSRSVNGYLSHVARRATHPLVLGIARAPGAAGATFDLRVERESGAAVPPPQPQRVLLNFAGGQNVQVHGRPAVSFPPFDGALLGGHHTQRTEVLKGAIRQRLERYYAPYEVSFITTDDQPVPGSPYSTIHFGGYDPDSLGVADALDLYNRGPDDSAIVYVHSFIQYASLDLSSYELGCMMGDVAAHELGHLLGLFHTQGGLSLMDNGRSIEVMVGGSGLDLVALAPEVFPYGSLDPVMLLEDGVGRRSGGLSGPAPLAIDADASAGLHVLAKSLRRALYPDPGVGWCGLCADAGRQ